MTLLTSDEILQMFRDFGLEHPHERERLLSMTYGDAPAAEGDRMHVFIRGEASTGGKEDADAKLAYYS